MLTEKGFKMSDKKTLLKLINNNISINILNNTTNSKLSIFLESSLFPVVLSIFLSVWVSSISVILSPINSYTTVSIFLGIPIMTLLGSCAFGYFKNKSMLKKLSIKDKKVYTIYGSYDYPLHLPKEKRKKYRKAKSEKELLYILINEMSENELIDNASAIVYYLKESLDQELFDFIFEQLTQEQQEKFRFNLFSNQGTVDLYYKNINEDKAAALFLDKKEQQLLEKGLGTADFVDLKREFITNNFKTLLKTNNHDYYLDMYKFFKKINYAEGKFFELEKILYKDGDQELSDDINKKFKNQSVYNF